MAVASNIGPLLSLLFLFNSGKAALPFLRHRFAMYPLGAILGAYSLLLVMCGLVIALSDESFHIVRPPISLAQHALLAKKRREEGRPAPSLPTFSEMAQTSGQRVNFSAQTFLFTNVSMTSLMSMSLLVLIAWLVDRAYRAWTTILVDVISQVSQFPVQFWGPSSDLRGLSK